MTYHSLTGGSRAAQFIRCPGSVALNRLFAGEDAGADEPDYRRDGVIAHAMAAQCLKEGLDAWELISDEFPAEHALAVQFYLDTVREEAVGAELIVEEFSEYGPDFAGSLDVRWVGCAGQHCVIRDYKHGVGVAVDAVNNEQLLYYAELVRRANPAIDRFDLGIVQPRAFHPDGPVRTWLVTAGMVQRWAEQTLLPAIERTKTDVQFVPGDHCRFCSRKLVCPALVGMGRAVALVNDTGLEFIQSLTDEQLGREYQLTKPAEMYFRAVAVETQKRALQGRPVPGVKVVKKIVHRQWRDGAEDNFRGVLGDQAYDITLKSPAQIEAMVGKETVKNWTETPDTGYTIAPETDRRKEVVPTAIPQAYLDRVQMIEYTDSGSAQEREGGQ